METRHKTISPEILLEEYRQLLARDDVPALPLVVSGGSMRPFLAHGRDAVYLSRLTRPVRVGDVLLYQRQSGAYVLHRVWKVTEQGFTMVGDAQTVTEPGIRQEQVIAIVTGAVRKGKQIGPGSFWWTFFEKIWIRMLPMRNIAWIVYSRLAKYSREMEIVTKNNKK